MGAAFSHPCTTILSAFDIPQQMRTHHLSLFMSRPVSAAVALGAAATCIFKTSTIHNDLKRRFYEDEASVNPVPGTTIPSTETQQEILGPRSVINGVTVRSISSVESAFRSLRETVTRAVTATQDYLDEGKVKMYQAERDVTGTVSALHDRREDLLPNSIYIVIASLSGNIMARQRGVLAKVFFPVGLGLASFKYFLPQTFSNTMGFLWKVEQRSMPALATTQVAALEKTERLVNQVEQTAVSGQEKVSGSMESLRKKIITATGLNLDEEVSKK